jgi:hypothetical protein
MALAAAATNEYLGRLISLKSFITLCEALKAFLMKFFCDFKFKFSFQGDKEHSDIERERELYEYQHQQQHSPPPQQQTVHLTPNHPHLRHIGHPPSSLICIQPPHQQQQPSHNPVQSHCTSHEQLHEMQIKKDSQTLVQNPSHYHQTQNGESRPSVIESSQPMIIECT